MREKAAAQPIVTGLLLHLRKLHCIVVLYLEDLVSTIIVYTAKLNLERRLNRIGDILDQHLLLALQAHLLKTTLEQSGLVRTRPALNRVFHEQIESNMKNSEFSECIERLEMITKNGLLKILLTAYLTFPEEKIRPHGRQIIDFLSAIVTKPADVDIRLDFHDLFSVVLVKAKCCESISFYKRRIGTAAARGIKRIFVVGIGLANSLVARAAADAFLKEYCNQFEIQVKEGFDVTCHRTGRASQGICVYLRLKDCVGF